MVDKSKRLEAAKLIEDFISCRISNFEYDDRYPRSDDPALLAIYSMLWFGYSDVREHRMDGKHTLSEEGMELIERCILFLKSDNEYHGTKNFVSLSAPFKRLWNWLLRKPKEQISPNWPFDSVEQLEAARR